MSTHLRVVSIASGSSGNAILIEAGQVHLLVDAGMTAKRLASELRSLSLDPCAVDAVFLTHEHTDHVGAVAAFSRRHKVPIVGNEKTLAAAKLGFAEQTNMAPGATINLGEVTVTSFPLPHDGVNPVGYLVEHEGHRICLATDLGYVPEALKEFVHGSDLIILEANHDQNRLVNGPYPASLKSRILSYTGHLSNEQAAQCLGQCVSGRPQWVWLAHLSDVNNSPRCALRTVKSHLRQLGVESVHVDVALRDRRSLIWDAQDAWYQPKLF